MNVGVSLPRALFLWELALAVILHGFVRDCEGIKTSIRGFCQIAGGNQGAASADRPLEPHGAPRITLDLQLSLMM